VGRIEGASSIDYWGDESNSNKSNKTAAQGEKYRRGQGNKKIKGKRRTTVGDARLLLLERKGGKS